MKPNEMMNGYALGLREGAIEEARQSEESLEPLMWLLLAVNEGRVVVLPCKVGDTVYNCLGKSYKVEKIVIQSGQKHIKFVLTSALTGQLIVDETDFGQIVFITLEEAEQSLKAGDLT